MRKHVLLALLLCLALCLPALASAEETAAKPMMDIVWVVDCTGSMINTLRTVNNNLDEFAAQLTDFDVQYGLVGFGDEVIYPPEPTVKIQWNGSAWTDKISDVQKSMVIGGKGGLPQYFGGDSAETSTIAITVAANQYAWREGANRQIILVTDIYPKPQQVVKVDGKWVEVPHVIATGDLCKSKDITVNLVDCKYATGYDEILNRTNGKKVSNNTSQLEQLAQWVHDTPVVVTQPEDLYVHEGYGLYVKSATLAGKKILCDLYCVKDGSTLPIVVNVPFQRADGIVSLPFMPVEKMDGEYFFRFTNRATGDTRSVETRHATLFVASEFAITGQPQDVTTEDGKTATFTVAATGDDLTYQWQKNVNGTWTNLSGETASTLSIPATLADNGSEYRCVIKDAISDKQPGGYTLTSESAALTVAAAPAITGQPQDVTTEAGKTAVFTVQATGTGLTYQWQKQVGDVWLDLPGETGATLTLTAALADSGSAYRCQATSSYGTVVTSSAATLTVVAAPAIATDPQNVTTEDGKTVTFAVTATGEGLTYQWQQLVGGVWVDLTGETGASLTIAATPENDGSTYRCQVTSSYGTVVTTVPVTLTVEAAPAISVQPESAVITEGEDVSFTVEATGVGLKYQWQVYRSGVWMNCTDGQASTLTLSGVALADDGLVYRCQITSGYGTTITSDAVTLTVMVKVELPQTGDGFQLGLWVALLGASLLGLIMLRRRRA